MDTHILQTLLNNGLHDANLIDDELGDSKESYRRQMCALFASINYCLDILEQEPSRPVTTQDRADEKPLSLSVLLVNRAFNRYELTDDDQREAKRTVWATSERAAQHWIEEQRTDLIGSAMQQTDIERWKETDIVVPVVQTGGDAQGVMPTSQMRAYLNSFEI